MLSTTSSRLTQHYMVFYWLVDYILGSFNLIVFLYRYLANLINKSTKVWSHKNEISEIMGFVRIFWKNNVQETYLPKMSIWGQIVSEIVAQLCLQNSIQTLLNFLGVDPKKKRRVCMEFSEYDWATISEKKVNIPAKSTSQFSGFTDIFLGIFGQN